MQPKLGTSATPEISQLPLPAVVEAWAFSLAHANNEKILAEILGENSSEGKYSRGSVESRPSLTPSQRRARVRQRMIGRGNPNTSSETTDV